MKFIFLIFLSCQSISLRPQTAENFLSKVEKLIQQNKLSEAKTNLLTYIPEEKYLKAQKYNLLGLISAKEKNMESAYQHFLIAKEEDPFNESILFNYFISALKTRRYNIVKKELENKQVNSFNLENKKKFYLIEYYLSQYENNNLNMFKSLFHYIKITQGSSSPYIKRLNYLYKNLTYEDQLYIDQNYAVIDPNLLSFLKQNQEIDSRLNPPLEENFFQKEFNQKVFVFLYPEIKFSEKIINTSKLFQKEFQDINIEYIDHTNTLPSNSILIGGLIPNKIQEELQLAKKTGSFYISLTPISSDQKNPFLLEIPPSLDSQFYALKNNFGLDHFVLITLNNLPVQEIFKKNFSLKESFNLNLEDLNFFFLKPYEEELSAEDLKKLEERSEELKLKEKSLSLIKKKTLNQKFYIHSHKPSDLITFLSYLENSNYSLKYFYTNHLIHQTRFQKKIHYFYDSSYETFKQKYLEEYSHSPGIFPTYFYEALSLIKEIQEKKETLQSKESEWNLIENQWIKKLKTSSLKL